MSISEFIGKELITLTGAVPTFIVAILVWKSNSKSEERANSISEANLKLALYDRRYELFNKIRNCIHEFIVNDKCDSIKLWHIRNDYIVLIQEIKYTFDESPAKVAMKIGRSMKDMCKNNYYIENNKEVQVDRRKEIKREIINHRIELFKEISSFIELSKIDI